MPAIVVAAIVTAAATTGATVYAAKKNQQAVDAQSKATSEATAAGAKGNEEALQFQKDQAAKDAAIQETNRKADYDQWAAREGRISTLGQALGLPARQIPGYVPQSGPPPATAPTIAGSQPSASGAPPASSAPPSGPAAGPINWTAPPDQLASQLSAYFKSKGVSDSETPYWVSKAPELVARGQQLNDPTYADTRLSQANVFGGGSGAGGTNTTSTAPTPGSILGTLQGMTGAPGYVSQSYQAPIIRPGTIRSSAGY